MAAILSLPPMAALDAAAAELVALAGNDHAAVNALNKAIWMLNEGVEIRPTTGAFLIPSATRNIIHRVEHTAGCNCEAARSGRICWHTQVLAIVEHAQRHTMPALTLGDRLAAARKATAALNELFA